LSGATCINRAVTRGVSFLAILVSTSALNAQQRAPTQSGPCTEQFVKERVSTNQRGGRADDAYFFSGALEKPVVGSAAAEQAFKPVAAQRTNMKSEPLKPDRIVATPSGEMTYEYGTSNVSFDEVSSGKTHRLHRGIPARVEVDRGLMQRGSVYG
jgi:hypothetical protein